MTPPPAARFNAFKKTADDIAEAAEAMANAGDPFSSDAARRLDMLMIAYSMVQDRNVQDNNSIVEIPPEVWSKMKHLTDQVDDALRDKMRPSLEKYSHESKRVLAPEEAGADSEALSKYRQERRAAEKVDASILIAKRYWLRKS